MALLVAKHLLTEAKRLSKAEAARLPTCWGLNEVITFGAPMVGDVKFARDCPLRNRLIPVANLNDPVPYMPPILGWKYQHVERAYHYELRKKGWKSVNLRGSMNKGRIRRSIDQWHNLSTLLHHGIAEHMLSRYIENLDSNLSKSP